MSLESATYINGLNTANPPAGDAVVNASDHLRLIKATIKNTFPNITGAVNATQKNLNSDFAPVGGIMLWYSTAASIPAGWGYCDGSTYAKLDGTGNIISPDMRDKFIVSAGVTYLQGTTGGAASFTPTITNTAYSLLQGDLPNCSFTVTDPGHIHAITDPGHIHSVNNLTYATLLQQGFAYNGFANSTSNVNTASQTTGISINSHTTGITVASGGSGNAHNHASSSNAVPTLPPYLSMVYMIKL